MPPRPASFRPSPRSIPSLALLFVALTASCAYDATPTPDPGALHWARHGHGAARVGSGVLLFGGHASGSARSADARRHTIWIDLATGTRSTRADMTTGRTFFASAVVDGRVYSIASEIECYDPARDQWRVVCRDPRLPRSHVTAAAVDSSIYIFAGLPADRPGFLRFDTETAQLHELPVPPEFTPGDHLAHLVEIDGALHLFGGLSGADTQPMTRHLVWNGATWQTRADSPVPIEAKFGAFGDIDGVLYFFGVYGACAYDPARDAWRDCAEMPDLRAMACSVVIDGRIHVIGGMNADDVLVYDPARDAWAHATTKLGD